MLYTTVRYCGLYILQPELRRATLLFHIKGCLNHSFYYTLRIGKQTRVTYLIFLYCDISTFHGPNHYFLTIRDKQYFDEANMLYDDLMCSTDSF